MTAAAAHTLPPVALPAVALRPTADVPTAPRTLAGLTRAGLAAALLEAGVPRSQVRMRVAQLWGWIYVRGVTSFDAMTDVSKDLRTRLAQRFISPARRSSGAGLDRRHAQVAAAAAAPRPRGARARGRDRLHPRGRPRHAVHLEPGRLHAQLPLLPHGHAGARAQPRGRGDRRADPARPRPDRRLARRSRPTTPPACPRPSARSPTSS